jgi:putative SOS response-associated peptidase YedK
LEGRRAAIAGRPRLLCRHLDQLDVRAEGETTNDILAFLTTEPNVEVAAVHPKAMPVILTTPDEVEA